jgi:hypothetical protein
MVQFLSTSFEIVEILSLCNFNHLEMPKILQQQMAR